MSTEDFQKAIKGTIIKYKEIIFGIDTPTCTECLNELRKQPVIDRIVYRKKLLEDNVRKLTRDNIAGDGETMIDKKSCEVLWTVVDYLIYYALSIIGTTDVWSICHFSKRNPVCLHFFIV